VPTRLLQTALNRSPHMLVTTKLSKFIDAPVKEYIIVATRISTFRSVTGHRNAMRTFLPKIRAVMPFIVTRIAPILRVGLDIHGVARSRVLNLRTCVQVAASNRT